MSEKIQVFWSFRSPYSYLVIPDLLRLQKDYDVDFDLNIVLPIAITSKNFVFDIDNKNKLSYIMLDISRRAEYLGRSITLPDPDPLVQDMKTYQLANEQPHIFRLCRLGVEANRRRKGVEFAASVSRRIWGGTKDWNKRRHMAQAAEEAGLDLSVMEKAIENSNHLEEVERNQMLLEKSGHWGVPTMVIRGEPFFGQDRVKTLEWRFNKLGLRKNKSVKHKNHIGVK